MASSRARWYGIFFAVVRDAAKDLCCLSKKLAS